MLHASSRRTAIALAEGEGLNISKKVGGAEFVGENAECSRADAHG